MLGEALSFTSAERKSLQLQVLYYHFLLVLYNFSGTIQDPMYIWRI